MGVGAVNSQKSASWGNGANSGGRSKRMGAPARTLALIYPAWRWNKLPSNQHSSDSADGNGKKFTNGWKSTEEEDQGSAASQTNEQNSVWAKAGGTVEVKVVQKALDASRRGDWGKSEQREKEKWTSTRYSKAL